MKNANLEANTIANIINMLSGAFNTPPLIIATTTPNKHNTNNRILYLYSINGIGVVNCVNITVNVSENFCGNVAAVIVAVL